MNHSVLFPGQGVQYPGMGKDLFPRYQKLVTVANDTLGYDIEDLCLNGPVEKLNRTEFAQLAILFVSYLQWCDFCRDNDYEVTFALGHSLGEYTALLAAEVFDLATALKVVQKRGALMTASPKGSMAAVLNLSNTDVVSIVAPVDVEVANKNTPEQTVIAGTLEDIIALRSQIEERGGILHLLQVSGAFHSSRMRTAAEQFAGFLEAIELKKPLFPVISNVTATPHEENRTKELLVKQVYSPVEWVESVRWVEQQGEVKYHELGPKPLLRKMVSQIKETLPDNINSIKEFKFSLGASSFSKRYGLKAPLMAGAMYKGISSPMMVSSMASGGYLASLGLGGLSATEVEESLHEVKRNTPQDKTFAVNLLAGLNNSKREMDTVKRILNAGVTVIEAAAFIEVTPALALFKVKGLQRQGERIIPTHRVIGKVSQLSIAQKFLEPIPNAIIEQLLDEQLITTEEANMATNIPLADDLTVESDSGGHTDQGIAATILPPVIALRDRMGLKGTVHVGLAGGIGTPESVLSAHVLGAEYVVTGSINQLTPESAQSEAVKTILAQISTTDTGYAPAGDMFEIGAKVQVVKKGILFPMRATKLFELYRQYNALSELPRHEVENLEKNFYHDSLESVYGKVLQYKSVDEVALIESNEKRKMAAIFKYYFSYASKQALAGEWDKINYQIHCGSSLGAFNEWVKGTKWEQWDNRSIVPMTDYLLNESEKRWKKITK